MIERLLVLTGAAIVGRTEKEGERNVDIRSIFRDSRDTDGSRLLVRSAVGNRMQRSGARDRH